MEIYCSNCGASLRTTLQSSKMVDCEYCETTQFIEDEGVRSLGARGVLLTPPALIEVGQSFTVQGMNYLPIGMIRYDYGYGTWDEFYCLSNNKTFWVSVDEGDIAIEQSLSFNKLGQQVADPQVPPKTLTYNDQLFTLLEHDKAQCVALRGELPEPVNIGDTHDFFDYGNALGQIITIERCQTTVSYYYGHWCDPFEIRLR